MLLSAAMGRTDQMDATVALAQGAALCLPGSLLERLVTPALVIDLARVRANVAAVLAVVGDPARWRPHVKSTKSPLVWRELLAAGVRRFKCATLREARELCALLEAELPAGDTGDVLLAHPAAGPTLAGLAALAGTHPRVRLSVLVEAAEQVAAVPAPLGVWLDLDPGDHRTGLSLGEPAEALAAARAAGPRLRGVHFYEGRHHQPDREERRAACFASHDALLGALGALRAQGVRVPELVTSGTPGFRSALAHPGLAALEGVRHQVSPGTVVLHDARSHEQEPDLGLSPAAVVVTRVVSRPTATRLTCDAGSKSVAAEAGDPCAVVLGHPGLVALAPSEEHLPLEAREGPVPARGAVLQLVPRHVCPTVNLAEAALFLDGERVLGVHPIPARAHDLLLEEPGP
jgi:D-serine deaminase-like pyridoxal phosphate-dependent protein